jgi:acetyltransferase-like isoleucine patch superfamily enzyme
MRLALTAYLSSRLKRKIFVHPRAICESSNVGTGTRIWAFSHVLPHAKIGQNCNICENVFIENRVAIGNNVTIKNGVQIWDGVSVEDNVFIGPNVTFCNDKFPQSGNKDFNLILTTIKQGASLGANSTILPGVEIGVFAVVGAGSVVTKNVGDYQVVAGNPARQISKNRLLN